IIQKLESMIDPKSLFLAEITEDITFRNVKRWTIDQVANWLQENNFKKYQKLFAKNNINGDLLLELDHEALRELKIRSTADR
ncbi:18057_t:CDS:2, partial [Racocetra persica]